MFRQKYSAKDLEEIAKDPQEAYRYSFEVLNGKPFKAGEAAIATNPHYSYWYSKNVLKGPFPAGEAVIAKDYYYSYYYAKNILKGRFALGEINMANSEFKNNYVNLLESLSFENDTLLLYSIQRLLDRGEKVYLDFKEGELVQKGLITKIYKNIVYAETTLGVWFVMADADEYFTLRKVNNKLVVQKA